MVHLLIGELYYAALTVAPDDTFSATELSSSAQIFLDRLRSVYRELPILADLSRDLTVLSVIDLSGPLKKILVHSLMLKNAKKNLMIIQ